METRIRMMEIVRKLEAMEMVKVTAIVTKMVQMVTKKVMVMQKEDQIRMTKVLSLPRLIIEMVINNLKKHHRKSQEIKSDKELSIERRNQQMKMTMSSVAKRMVEMEMMVEVEMANVLKLV